MNLLIYNLPSNPSAKTKLNRILFGYKDSSNKGKYHYERDGFLQKGMVEKPARNTLLVHDLHLTLVKQVISDLGGSFIVKELK